MSEQRNNPTSIETQLGNGISNSNGSDSTTSRPSESMQSTKFLLPLPSPRMRMARKAKAGAAKHKISLNIDALQLADSYLDLESDSSSPESSLQSIRPSPKQSDCSVDMPLVRGTSSSSGFATDRGLSEPMPQNGPGCSSDPFLKSFGFDGGEWEEKEEMLSDSSPAYRFGVRERLSEPVLRRPRPEYGQTAMGPAGQAAGWTTPPSSPRPSIERSPLELLIFGPAEGAPPEGVLDPFGKTSQMNGALERVGGRRNDPPYAAEQDSTGSIPVNQHRLRRLGLLHIKREPSPYSVPQQPTPSPSPPLSPLAPAIRSLDANPAAAPCSKCLYTRQSNSSFLRSRTSSYSGSNTSRARAGDFVAPLNVSRCQSPKNDTLEQLRPPASCPSTVSMDHKCELQKWRPDSPDGALTSIPASSPSRSKTTYNRPATSGNAGSSTPAFVRPPRNPARALSNAQRKTPVFEMIPASGVDRGS